MKVLAQALIAGAALVAAAPAGAVTLAVAPYAFDAPAGGTLIDFDHALPTGFTLTGGYVQQGYAHGATPPVISAPPPYVFDTSYYLAVTNAKAGATLVSTSGFDSVSLYLASIDSFNTLQVLGAGGTVLETLTGSDIAALPGYVHNNDRLTITNAPGDAEIYGFHFTSAKPAFEVDNIVFGGDTAGAVPEPATWAMMLGGFGLVGVGMRRRSGRMVQAI